MVALNIRISLILNVSNSIAMQSTRHNRATSGPGRFDPIKRRNLLTENIVSQTVIPSYKSCENFDPIKQ